jgi:hypothetical protein
MFMWVPSIKETRAGGPRHATPLRAARNAGHSIAIRADCAAVTAARLVRFARIHSRERGN